MKAYEKLARDAAEKYSREIEKGDFLGGSQAVLTYEDGYIAGFLKAREAASHMARVLSLWTAPDQMTMGQLANMVRPIVEKLEELGEQDVAK